MLEAILALVASAAGFAAGKLWEQYTEKRKEIELELWRIRVQDIEKRLREFFWPIYLRLQRDNVIWEKILKRKDSDEDTKKLAYKIESEILLPNHSQIVSTIEGGMHYIRDDKELELALLQYLRHIDVYRSLRAANIIDKDPIAFDEPYPPAFFEIIQDRVHTLQKQYDSIVQEKTNG